MTAHNAAGADLRALSEHRLARLEKSVASIEKTLVELVVTAELVKQDAAHIKKGLEDVLGTVRTLAASPASRWNALITAATSAAMSAFVAWILTR